MATVERPSGSSILVVDDELTFVETLDGYLSDIGFRVSTATSLGEAWNLLSQRRFDAVITDLVFESEGEVGFQSGIDLIKAIKQKDPAIPVIVLSGYALDFADQLEALDVPVLSKTRVSGNTLSGTIEQTIMQFRRGKISSADAEASALRLEDIRLAFAEEAAKLIQSKERTLNIPGEGQYDLPKPLVGFKKDIERQLLKFPFERNVFLMMKFRPATRDIGLYIKETLQAQGFIGVRADEPHWNITRNLYNPVAVLHCCKYGIALFDEPEKHQAYSANVAYELGMLHQQNKDCLILKHKSLPHVPFDLIKDLYVEYERDLQLQNRVKEWLNSIGAQPDGGQ